MAQTEFLSPGVFGIETAPTRAEEGISPAKMGIIGWTEQGPVNTPIEVRSVNEFTSFFGPINPRGVVALSMRAFFGTGGQRAWVTRVVPADAVEAQGDIDAPAKWTFIANGAGAWGNDLVIQVEGNRNFLDRTPGSEAWTKFDLKVLKPTDFDPAILGSAETFEAVQFTDPLASDYLLTVMLDPRNPSQLVRVLAGLGGDPDGLGAVPETDEVIGTSIGLAQFTGTLGNVPVLDGTLTIIASDAQISDEAQTPTPAPDSIATGFTFTLPTVPVLDGSVRLFSAAAPAVANELVTVTGAIDDANTVYTVAAGALTDKVHRETSVFRLKYAATGSASGPNLLHTDGGGGLAHDLSTTPLTLGLPAHPGTTVLLVDIGGGPTPQTDDGSGNFPITAELPAGGTINYDTGALTGITAPLLAASTITETHNTSSIITKTSSGDNLELGAALAGAVTVGTIDLVDSVTTPTGSGPLSFTTTVSPTAGTTFFLDFVPLQVIESDVAGNLTGDVGIGTNTVDFTTGAVDVELAAAALTGETIDASYQTGQVATDDGLGNLIGDVDAAGANTIDYETGAFDVTFDSAPLTGTDVLANYTKLARVVQFPLAGGLNGTAVTRAEISDPSLEDAREGVYAFDDVEDPLNLVVPDFEGSLFVQADIVDYCEARNTRFAVLGFANGTTKEEAIKYVLVDQAFDTKCAAIYWPNVFFVNEASNRAELVPVTPFIAGVYAKTAFNKNVGKNPGGIEDGALDANGTLGPEFGTLVNDIRVRDDLYQSRINPLFNSDTTGFVVWGVRTLSTEFRWRYVNARLLHNFLMDAISRQLTWAVFENNGPQLWVKIETALKGFMGSLFRQGFFAGVLESQAFFVVANATNNNQATVDAGQVIIDIGFSPFKPAEFIIFRLSQPASTITV